MIRKQPATGALLCWKAVARVRCGLVTYMLLMALVGGAVSLMPSLAHGEVAPRPAPAMQRVTVATAGPAVFARTIRLTGTVVARDDIAIGTPLQDQRVTAVLVEEGDRVKAGQILARLDTTTLDARVRDARSAVDRARAAVAQQQALDADAQAVWRRIEPLGRSGAVSDQQVDQQRAQVAAAAANLRGARADEEQALARLAEARAERDKAIVSAPTDGVIASRAVRAGALAGGEPLFRLIARGELEFDGDVAERELGAIRAGQRATIVLPDTPGTVDGTVRLIAPRIDPQTRMGKVRVALGDASRLRAGGFARAELAADRIEVPVAVPQRAVTFGAQDAAFVSQVDAAGRVTRRAIVAGRRDGAWIEVRSGLKAGDHVVAVASALVRDGDIVQAAGNGVAGAK
ncbi:efflux RND transporter periplasmic adaptor subunit [Burkholderia sp. AU31624]|uniref:efflux RND transporter periplasmic adaptor subunit n=1 Tax=unclassified Burkholderia TaxID=2613784 RepID=UPI000B7A3660|nr:MULTISPECIES: efflux RND transporter periplasmic adaptor subunit [unclassified Burkholderia]MCA8256158.1 efflux RND transporter periplasmic adaptor subunit [Burkholderia sp. AU31624]OXI15501.1 efflux transporter periplasmic adaptor subunit [Burkholderia sp. AU15512]